MNNEQVQISKSEAQKTLSQLHQTKQTVRQSFAMPALLSITSSLSYAAMVLGWGLTSHENLWALAIWIGGFGLLTSMLLAFYTARLLGRRANFFPKTINGLKFTAASALAFAILTVFARQGSTLGIHISPYIAAVLSGVLLFIIQTKFPAGELHELDSPHEQS